MLKTVSSVANALGALNYKGTWDASTNTPTLASGVGTQGDYYVVSVAGATDLDGITNWGVGDWAAFNGSVWQRVEGGADGNFVDLTVTGEATVGTINLTSNTISTTNTNGDLLLDPNGTGKVGVNELSPDRTFSVTADAVIPVRFESTGRDNQLEFANSVGTPKIGSFDDNFLILTGGSETVRVDSSGHLIVPAGITLGTATGVHTTANTLDDYEEGTWTPTVTPATGSFTTVTVNYATYVKVGGIVHVSARYTLTDIGTGSGSMNIAGFPYTLSSGQGNIEFVGRHVNTGDLMSGQFSGSIFSFEKYDGTSSTAASGVYTFMFTYRHV